MAAEGKYIYGVIATDEAPNFGPIGIGDRGSEVVTIGTKDLAAIVSDTSADHYTASPGLLKAHMQVIEKVFESFTILPMSFGTIAESTDEVVAFLEANARPLKNSLKDIEGKVEVGIKILWKDMKKMYEEIAKENRAIRELKAKGVAGNQKDLVHAGQLVEAALEEKKAVEGEEYTRPLKKGKVEFKEGDLKTEDMVVNASFLLDREWLKEFDGRIEKISEEFNGRIQVKYIGPMPPFSFVNLELHWNGKK